MGKSIRTAKRWKKSLDDLVEMAAWYLGWFGLGLLVCCLLLWLIPTVHWDGVAKLRSDKLPVYTLIALLLSSLVGWRYVNEGESRITKKLGKQVSFVLFLIIPIFCILSELAQKWVVAETGMTAPDHPFWIFVRWYPPVLIMLSATVFLLWKSRPRKRVYFDRGLGYALLLAPYAILFAFLELGVYLDWLDDSMKGTFGELGQYSLALQLVTAYFIGGD